MTNRAPEALFNLRVRWVVVDQPSKLLAKRSLFASMHCAPHHMYASSAAALSKSCWSEPFLDTHLVYAPGNKEGKAAHRGWGAYCEQAHPFIAWPPGDNITPHAVYESIELQGPPFVGLTRSFDTHVALTHGPGIPCESCSFNECCIGPPLAPGKTSMPLGHHLESQVHRVPSFHGY